jgi:hypothetical protein
MLIANDQKHHSIAPTKAYICHHDVSLNICLSYLIVGHLFGNPNLLQDGLLELYILSIL